MNGLVSHDDDYEGVHIADITSSAVSWLLFIALKNIIPPPPFVAVT